jgi:fimbrial chaperone protein
MNRSSIGQALRGLALLAAALGSNAAYASSFSVNPVRVTLSAKQPVAAITVRNSDREQTVVQLEATAWTQVDGKDVQVPSSDLLATPPIFTLPPGGSQIVRVGLRGARKASREVTYRLSLREVPPSQPSITGLRVALRISMPIFVVPTTPVAPDIKWRATRGADGTVRVTATNTGNAHVQLGKLELLADGNIVATRNIAEYVLPGNARGWTIDAAGKLAAGAQMRISATSDAGPMQADVALEMDTAARAPATSAAAAPRPGFAPSARYGFALSARPGFALSESRVPTCRHGFARSH